MTLRLSASGTMSTIPGAAARHCEALQSEAPAGLRPAPLGRECWRWEPRSGRHFPGRRPKKAHAFEILRAAGREKKRALLKFTDVRGASEVPNWCWTALSVSHSHQKPAYLQAAGSVEQGRSCVSVWDLGQGPIVCNLKQSSLTSSQLAHTTPKVKFGPKLQDLNPGRSWQYHPQQSAILTVQSHSQQQILSSTPS